MQKQGCVGSVSKTFWQVSKHTVSFCSHFLSSCFFLFPLMHYSVQSLCLNMSLCVLWCRGTAEQGRNHWSWGWSCVTMASCIMVQQFSLLRISIDQVLILLFTRNPSVSDQMNVSLEKWCTGHLGCTIPTFNPFDRLQEKNFFPLQWKKSYIPMWLGLWLCTYYY